MPKKTTSAKKKRQKIIKEDSGDLERYIEQLSAFLPIATCDLTSIGIITFINSAFKSLSGYQEIDIVGEPVKTVFKESQKFDEIIERTAKEKVVKEELTLITKGNEEIPVSVSISARKNGGGENVGFFVSLIDITETKNSRKQLQKLVEAKTGELEKSKTTLVQTLQDVENSRKALINMLEDVEAEKQHAEEEARKTKGIVAALTDGLLMFSPEKNLFLVNLRTERYLGVKAEDILGMEISGLNAFPSLAKVMEIVGENIKRVFRQELIINENLVIEVTSTPIANLGNLIILHDITREKVIERTKTEFVSIAAHQLRTPLSAIKWTLEMLLSGDLGEITSEQREFIQKSYDSNERMIDLINDLLNVTRIEEGRYVFRQEVLDITELLDSILASYETMIKQKEITVKFNKPRRRLPNIVADKEKLELAISNLIDNAVKYSSRQGKIYIDLVGDGEKIRLSVKDAGVGIPEDQQKRIFSKFFRGANVMKLETEGNGLGLFIAKNIVDAHEGKIWFESKEGEGSTFFVEIPTKKEYEKFIEGI